MDKPSVRLAQYRELWQRQIASDNNLTASARLFGVAISWHLNQHTLEAWPSLNTIAVLTAMSNRTVMGSGTIPREVADHGKSRPGRGGDQDCL